MPAAIGTIVSKRLATLHELDTVYGTQDVYDMLEIIAVDNHNLRILNKAK
ncbi:MAG: transcription elongation factor GreA [Pseudomonadota bacterium]